MDRLGTTDAPRYGPFLSMESVPQLLWSQRDDGLMGGGGPWRMHGVWE